MEEFIDGYTILKRELTEEEATRKVTAERIYDYMSQVGEDFIDQHESILNHTLMAGFLLARFPHYSKEILEIENLPFPGGSCQEFMHMFGEIEAGIYGLKYEDWPDEYDDTKILKGEEKFYELYTELIDLTTVTKKKVNQILIQIEEHYA